jgi:hypothetical protein
MRWATLTTVAVTFPLLPFLPTALLLRLAGRPKWCLRRQIANLNGRATPSRVARRLALGFLAEPLGEPDLDDRLPSRWKAAEGPSEALGPQPGAEPAERADGKSRIGKTDHLRRRFPRQTFADVDQEHHRADSERRREPDRCREHGEPSFQAKPPPRPVSEP